MEEAHRFSRWTTMVPSMGVEPTNMSQRSRRCRFARLRTTAWSPWWESNPQNLPSLSRTPLPFDHRGMWVLRLPANPILYLTAATTCSALRFAFADDVAETLRYPVVRCLPTGPVVEQPTTHKTVLSFR